MLLKKIRHATNGSFGVSLCNIVKVWGINCKNENWEQACPGIVATSVLPVDQIVAARSSRPEPNRCCCELIVKGAIVELSLNYISELLWYLLCNVRLRREFRSGGSITGTWSITWTLLRCLWISLTNTILQAPFHAAETLDPLCPTVRISNYSDLAMTKVTSICKTVKSCYKIQFNDTNMVA